MRTTMRALAGLLQRVGLILPPIAIVLELMHSITLGQMLMLLVVAVCAFWLGRLSEGYFLGR